MQSRGVAAVEHDVHNGSDDAACQPARMPATLGLSTVYWVTDEPSTAAERCCCVPNFALDADAVVENGYRSHSPPDTAPREAAERVQDLLLALQLLLLGGSQLLSHDSAHLHPNVSVRASFHAVTLLSAAP
jgi:hypothetical protein